MPERVGIEPRPFAVAIGELAERRIGAAVRGQVAARALQALRRTAHSIVDIAERVAGAGAQRAARGVIAGAEIAARVGVSGAQQLLDLIARQRGRVDEIVLRRAEIIARGFRPPLVRGRR